MRKIVLFYTKQIKIIHLKLHLGLMKIDRTCSDDAIEAISRLRLQPAGWSLLQIVNVSKDIEVEKIKRDLGEYFLKY